MSQTKNKIVFLLGFVLISCTSQFRPDDTIARINGEPVTVRDYMSVVQNMKPKDSAPTKKESSEVKALVIKSLVRRQVILTEARRRGIEISPEEWDQGINKYKQGYTPETFEQHLFEEMVDEKEWREEIKRNL